VAGINGDKPLAVLSLFALIERLHAIGNLDGTVLVIPAVNPFGLQGGLRHNPDLLEINRRFPGKASGFITDQLALVVFSALVGRVDSLIDLHSGTSSRRLHYAYDYGDEDFSASFGFLPVVRERGVPGQLCTAMSERGKRAVLAEFGGAECSSIDVGVEGCLNVLRFCGHVRGVRYGPSLVPVIDHVKVFLASREGILVSRRSPSDCGNRVDSGEVARIICTSSGEPLERFLVEDIGQTAGIGQGFDLWGPRLEREFHVKSKPFLMLANSVPSLIHAGDFASIVGWSDRSIQLDGVRGL
jgi:predicted deacylase